MDMNLFFFHNLATYCSSLLYSGCNIFFRRLFSLSCAHLRFHTNDAQISSSCFQIQHQSPDESIKKENKKREEMK